MKIIKIIFVSLQRQIFKMYLLCQQKNLVVN